MVKHKRHWQGFTLIEVMLVVVILSVLGALVVPNFFGRDDSARAVAAKSDLRALASALALYRLDNGFYPSTSQGLAALIAKPAGAPLARHWNASGYLRSHKIPEDPWGGRYQYELTAQGYRLFSLGKDGQPGGDGYAADLRYPEDL